MTDVLRFAEPASLQDLAHFIGRARRIQEQGIRVHAHQTVLAAWVPVMTPSSLVGRLPAVLGLRTMALREASAADVTAELGAFSERIARLGPADTELTLPVARLNAPWAAVTPPRTGWEQLGTVDDDVLRAAAERGIDEVASTVPDTAGAAVVEQVRECVWSASITAPQPPAQTGTAPADGDGPDDSPGRAGVVAGLPAEIPAGAAFGSYALGFLRPAGEAGSTAIHSQGRWIRLSSTGGHILCRRSH